jgi:hypothetical protein
MKNHHSIDLATINIDPHIRPLVELFVKHGIKTIASCQGHGQLPPYLAFYENNLDKVCELNCLIHKELAKENTPFYWGWSVTPWLRNNAEIAWSLSTTNPMHWFSKFWRPHLDSDLLVLHQLINQHFENIGQINPTLDMSKHSKAGKHNEKELHFLGKSSFSKRIGRLTSTTFNCRCTQLCFAINTLTEIRHRAFFLVKKHLEFNLFKSKDGGHLKKEALS